MNDLNILNELNDKDFNIILKHLKTMGLRYFIKKLNIKISNEMKDAVIRLYLQGTSRNDIAKTCGIGDGTVSNIIDEWKHRLDIHDAEDLMDLAATVKRLGIDMPAQCAEGFRILRNMKKSDVNENQFESFNLRIYE